MTTLAASPPEHGADGVRVRQVVEQKYPRVAQPRDEGQHVAQHPAHLQAVHEEAHHPRQHQGAGGQVQPLRLFPPEEDRQQDDKDRGCELQNNGVGGGGQLVGHGEEHVGAAYAHRSQGDPPVQPQPVPAHGQIAPHHQQRHHVPGTVDAQAVPGDHLDAQSPDAVQHSGQEDEQRAPLPLRQMSLSLQKNTPRPLPPSGGYVDRGRQYRGTTSDSPASRGARPQGVPGPLRCIGRARRSLPPESRFRSAAQGRIHAGLPSPSHHTGALWAGARGATGSRHRVDWE